MTYCYVCLECGFDLADDIFSPLVDCSDVSTDTIPSLLSLQVNSRVVRLITYVTVLQFWCGGNELDEFFNCVSAIPINEHELYLFHGVDRSIQCTYDWVNPCAVHLAIIYVD